MQVFLEAPKATEAIDALQTSGRLAFEQVRCRRTWANEAERVYLKGRTSEVRWRDRADLYHPLHLGPDAAVWVAGSEDVPGLATGAESLDALVEKLKIVIPELLEANGLLPADRPGDVPFAIIAERHERAPVAA